MITVGTDPEFVIVDAKNKPRSAINIVKGSKTKRIRMKKHEFFYDNVLAECSISPANSKETLIKNIRESLGIYAKMKIKSTLSRLW